MGTCVLTFGKYFVSLGYDSPVPEHRRNSPVRGYRNARSNDVLSPSNSQEQRPMSREFTESAMAREPYYQRRQPTQRDTHMQSARYDSHANVRTAFRKFRLLHFTCLA